MPFFMIANDCTHKKNNTSKKHVIRFPVSPSQKKRHSPLQQKSPAPVSGKLFVKADASGP